MTQPGRGARGISAFVVEAGTPGYRVGKHEDKMGIRCVPVVEIHLENCRVSKESDAGRRRAGVPERDDDARPRASGRGGAGAWAWPRARSSWPSSTPGKRKQFGQSINAFQGIQWMLADMGTQIEAARTLVHTAARAADAKAKNVSKLSAMCKLFATDVAMMVTTNAVQLFGGYGYCKDYPIEKYMRDAKITQIYEGTNQIQRLVIARSILREAASSRRWKSEVTSGAIPASRWSSRVSLTSAKRQLADVLQRCVVCERQRKSIEFRGDVRLASGLLYLRDVT